jgi:hypothetical protein
MVFRNMLGTFLVLICCYDYVSEGSEEMTAMGHVLCIVNPYGVVSEAIFGVELFTAPAFV